MKKIRNKIIIPVILALALMACETTELNLLDDPNQVSPERAAPDLLLNNIQLMYEDFLYGMNIEAMEMSRMENLFGAYTGPFAAPPASWNFEWRDAYREVLQDVSVLLPLAENQDLSFHSGVAKIIQAHTLVTLVDFFGDVPFSEALQGDLNPNPTVDDDAELYDLAFETLTSAISDLSDSSSPPIIDLFYGGNRARWITFANTLQLKMFNQIRLVDPSRATAGINSLMSQGNLILDAADDFQFQYSTSGTPAESRHPEFVANYGAANASDYMSNYFMTIIKDQKSMVDPRIRYYFFRQELDAPTGPNLPCDGDVRFDFCYIGDGYWGRDHGDNTGVPADTGLRTTWGIYPAGGSFDNDSEGPRTLSNGLQGAGIFPIYLSFFTHFTLSEAILTLGVAGDARTELETAIRQSFSKVLAFGPGDVANFDSALEPQPADLDAYVDEVLADWDAATNDTDRLDIIAKEYLIAAWGNGLEPYNTFRRTGLPSDMQSPVIPAGPFPRTVLYPTNFSDLNTNAPNKPVTVRVFWDTNPDNFID